jgi:hypothetical protein
LPERPDGPDAFPPHKPKLSGDMRAGWAELHEVVHTVVSRSVFFACFPFDKLIESYLS